MNTFAAISWVAGTMFVLFKTTAVYEYFKVLPLPERITKIKEYKKEKLLNYALSYKMFWMTTHDSFFIRLVTCPYCLGAWLSLGFSAIFSCIEWVPAVYLGGLSTYFGVSALINKLEWMESTNE
jgi:hypothetical protein